MIEHKEHQSGLQRETWRSVRFWEEQDDQCMVVCEMEEYSGASDTEQMIEAQVSQVLGTKTTR
jgi:hypothetical protein